MPGGRNRRLWFSLGYVLVVAVVVLAIILVIPVLFPEPLDAIL